MARDLLGQIANARARMMLRGYETLRLEVGTGAFEELVSEGAIIYMDLVLLGMPVKTNPDWEGFRILAD